MLCTASIVYAVVRCLSVYPSVCLSQAGMLPKGLKAGSHKRHKIAQGLVPKTWAKFQQVHPEWGHQIEVG